jgi:uncharacterized RDD family membrane protein YckC
MNDETQPGGPVQPWGPPDAAAPTPPEPVPPAPVPPEPASTPAAPWPDPIATPAAPSAPSATAAASAPPVAWAAAPAVQPGIPVPGSPGIYFASIWARFAALIVDSLIIAVIEFVFGFIVGLVLPGTATFDSSTPFGTVPRANPAALALAAIFALVVTYLYYTTQWRGAHRATVGMRAFSVQVGNAFDGVALTARQATLRWVGLGFPLGLLSALASTAGIGGLLILLLDIALFLTTLGSTTRQGWHDQFANSAVIRRPGTSGSNSGAIAVVVVLLVLGAIALFAIVALIFLGGAMSNILSDVGSSI